MTFIRIPAAFQSLYGRPIGVYMEKRGSKLEDIHYSRLFFFCHVSGVLKTSWETRFFHDFSLLMKHQSFKYNGIIME